MRAATFAIVGAGWRTEFYLRIARELPTRFHCVGVVARDPAKAERLRGHFHVPILAQADPIPSLKPDFVVTSVGWGDNPDLVRTFAEAGIPVLSETPPAPDLEAMSAMSDLLSLGPKIQVAEQVALRPAYQALKAAKPLLGEVNHVQVSVAHGYHGVSVLEELLGVQRCLPKIRAHKLTSRIVAGPDREGAPRQERVKESQQTVAWLDYPDSKFGMFDFTGDQYFAWIRSSRALVRGPQGEADLTDVRWLSNYRTPLSAPFVRRETGRGDDLFLPSLEGITLGSDWLYRNPFAGARLSDDEIAIATMMQAMAEGREIYPLARAMHDHQVAMAIDRAAESGEMIEVPEEPWHRLAPTSRPSPTPE